MFQKLSNAILFTNKLGDRAKQQEVLKQILLCTIYDNVKTPFYKEDNGNGERISIYDRRPIVDVGLGLIRKTVDTSISFVFGEGRFPNLECQNEDLRTSLLELIKESNLVNTMQEAMLWGSLGSVAIHVAFSEQNRVHFKVHPTQFLTPVWDPDEPDQLLSITEKYVTTNGALRKAGYDLDPKEGDLAEYFFQRMWDTNEEVWYQPWPTTIDPTQYAPIRDNKRSIIHKLGIVPFVWIKNLPGGDEVDGTVTFMNAIKTCIEIDYLVSQGDRGLKYMADPMLVVSGANDPEGDIIKSVTTALSLDKDGKAEILEMRGTAYNTLLETWDKLREAALEAMGGNRSSPEKMTAAQSGTALEQLWQPTIMLAGDLRNSYGERGLLQLLKMVTLIGSQRFLKINNKIVGLMPSDEEITLRWGPYFEATTLDLQQQAQTMQVLITSRVLSQRTAIKKIAEEYEIDDVDEEIAQIQLEEAAQDAREIAMAAQIQIKTSQN